MTKSNWIKEIARDILALGSIVFYFLVLGRALIGPFWIFFSYLCTAAVVLLIIFLIHKDYETYLARGLVLAVGTSVFYNETIFTFFASVIYLLMIIASYITGNSIKKIFMGISFALFAVLAGYLATEFVKKEFSLLV
jgi:hypothetical protein